MKPIHLDIITDHLGTAHKAIEECLMGTVKGYKYADCEKFVKPHTDVIVETVAQLEWMIAIFKETFPELSITIEN